MDPEAFTATFYKWDPRPAAVPPPALLPAPPSVCLGRQQRDMGGLEELFQAYGIRYLTALKIAELGFTVSTLVNMKDDELDDMMNSLSQIFRWDLLVGERYGVKAAVRAERRRLDDDDNDSSRHRHVLSSGNTVDAFSQEGLSEEPVQQEREAAGSGGGGGTWELAKKQRKKKKVVDLGDGGGGDEEEDENGGGDRQREHPFIVTEPGEVARGKKNGLDYLFHLYEQCREFLTQVQTIAKERGEKCPTKVTNQVFRYAKKAGANYINKPKMRHYVHCYALHCLHTEASDALRREYKERGENVGAWRQACYKPLVAIAARQGWDIDAIFSSHPRLAVWYVPTKLRQLCHAERNAAASGSVSGGHGADPLLF